MRRLQWIELAVRSAFQRLLVETIGGPRDVPLPDWRARPYRVLFLRDDGIGDLIISMEVVRAIAESSPTLRVDLLCSPQNAAFGRTLPFVDGVLVHRRGPLATAWPTWRILRGRGYDAVIDGRVAVGAVDTHTTCLMLATGARWRIGVGGRRNTWAYNVVVTPRRAEHFIDSLAVLAVPFGVDPSARDWRPRLAVSDDQRQSAEQLWSAVGAGRPRVLVNISVGNSERLWRHERFEPVLSRARQRLPGAAILVVAMPEDRAAAHRLAMIGHGAMRELSFAEVIGAVATADLVITPDTAITHVASAFQTPTLALMRKDTGPWAPYRTPGRIVFGDVRRRLEPGLPTERVVAALDELLTEMANGRDWDISPPT